MPYSVHIKRDFSLTQNKHIWQWAEYERSPDYKDYVSKLSRENIKNPAFFENVFFFLSLSLFFFK